MRVWQLGQRGRSIGVSDVRKHYTHDDYGAGSRSQAKSKNPNSGDGCEYRTKQKQCGRPVEPFESEVRNTEPHCGDDEDCDNDRRPKLKARTPYKST